MKTNGAHRTNAKKIYFILLVVLFLIGKFGFSGDNEVAQNEPTEKNQPIAIIVK